MRRDILAGLCILAGASQGLAAEATSEEAQRLVDVFHKYLGMPRAGEADFVRAEPQGEAYRLSISLSQLARPFESFGVSIDAAEVSFVVRPLPDGTWQVSDIIMPSPLTMHMGEAQTTAHWENSSLRRHLRSGARRVHLASTRRSALPTARRLDQTRKARRITESRPFRAPPPRPMPAASTSRCSRPCRFLDAAVGDAARHGPGIAAAAVLRAVIRRRFRHRGLDGGCAASAKAARPLVLCRRACERGPAGARQRGDQERVFWTCCPSTSTWKKARRSRDCAWRRRSACSARRI